MNFSTFGPYVLSEGTRNGLQNLWLEADRIQEKLGYPTALNRAIGVYVIAIEGGDGGLIPWYVGKTDRGFGIRFKQHLRGKKFRTYFSKDAAGLSIFFIARVTSTGKLKKVTAKMRETKKGLKSIDRLEFALIGSCLAKNPELENRKEKQFQSALHVPGYLNSDPKNYDAAARKLAKMLRIR